jgi:tetratricopeptide (TPR) repeat protein
MRKHFFRVVNSEAKRIVTTLSTIGLLTVAGHVFSAKSQSGVTSLINQVRTSVVTVIAFNGDGKPITQGTGFFVSSDGMLITNHHVLAGAAKASVKTKGGKVYDIVTTIAQDTDGDLVAVKVNLRGVAVHPLRLSNGPITSGQRVLVIGSPLGLEETVSEGIVSAVRQIEGIGRIIQITAPISPGSSGSPVINMRGEIIGVASLNLSGGQNLNFAIPSARILALIDRGRNVVAARGQSARTRRTRTVNPTNKKQIDEEAFDKMFAEMIEDERKSIPTLEARINKNPRDIEAYENLGRAYSNNQQPKKAIDVYERALFVAPENVSIQASLCEVYVGVDEYDKALPHCDKALRLKPSYSYALTTKGRALAGLGRTSEAIAVLKEAIKEDPKETYAHEQLGFIYMNLGQYEEAAKAFEFMASIASRYAPSFINLAWAYESLGRNDEAEVSYKKALQIDKRSDDAYIRLADLYERENRTADAIVVYKQAMAANSQNADAYLNLGLLYLSTGDRRSTLEIYEQLKKIDPNKARQLSGAIYK